MSKFTTWRVCAQQLGTNIIQLTELKFSRLKSKKRLALQDFMGLTPDVGATLVVALLWSPLWSPSCGRPLVVALLWSPSCGRPRLGGYKTRPYICG
jgi:hypothetical protein